MSLLSTATERIDYSRQIGTELRGIDLRELDDASIGELSRLVSERGVVVVRHAEMTVEEQVGIGRRLGPLHVHPAYADPDFPEALKIHADANSRYAAGEEWHSDVTCDAEPPMISMLRMHTLPSCGGDTAFASMYEAYEELSEPIKGLLEGLEAIHAGDLPWRGAYGSKSPKEYPVNVHPVVITHHVTGRKALYVNPGFTDRIKGVTKAESRALLDMLFDHVARGIHFQTRVRWEPHTITFWDNRAAQHYASWDYFPETRSGFRVTTSGPRPAR